MIVIFTVQCVVENSEEELSDKIELLENAGFSVNLEEIIDDDSTLEIYEEILDSETTNLISRF